MNKMKFRKGDTVLVITGKDKGKRGEIARTFPSLNQVLIEGVNISKRHKKATRGGSKGQIIEKAMPINASNVMIIDPKTDKQTRITIKRDANGRVRIARKSGVAIEK